MVSRQVHLKTDWSAMDRYLLISAKHQGILILYNKYATNIHKSNAAQTYAYTDQNGVPIFTLQMTPQTNTHTSTYTNAFTFTRQVNPISFMFYSFP